jgi:large subunit ribosomal protein L21
MEDFHIKQRDKINLKYLGASNRANFKGGPRNSKFSIPNSKFFPYLCSPIFGKTMYAIVNIAGQQFKVAKDQYIYAPKLDGEAGKIVDFDQVLLVDNGGKVSIGAPTVKGAKVSGKILEHVKGNKVIIFKKKRRKGYAVKNGHRQQYTKVLIESIG